MRRGRSFPLCLCIAPSSFPLFPSTFQFSPLLFFSSSSSPFCLSSSHLHLPFLYVPNSFLFFRLSFASPFIPFSHLPFSLPSLSLFSPLSTVFYDPSPPYLPTYFTTLYPRLDLPIDIHPTHSSSYFSSFVPLFLHISPSDSACR